MSRVGAHITTELYKMKSYVGSPNVPLDLTLSDIEVQDRLYVKHLYPRK